MWELASESEYDSFKGAQRTEAMPKGVGEVSRPAHFKLSLKSAKAPRAKR